MNGMIKKSWEQFIHKNLLNPEYVRKDVFQSWLRSRFYNIDPNSELKQACENIKWSNYRTWINTEDDKTVACVYLIDSENLVIEAIYNSNSDTCDMPQISNFNETQIGTSAVSLISDKHNVSYATCYEHYTEALHPYDTVCIKLDEVKNADLLLLYPECKAMVFLCINYITKNSDFRMLQYMVDTLHSHLMNISSFCDSSDTSVIDKTPQAINEDNLDACPFFTAKITDDRVYHFVEELTEHMQAIVNCGVFLISSKGHISEEMLNAIAQAPRSNFLLLITNTQRTTMQALSIPRNCFVVILDVTCKPEEKRQQLVQQTDGKEELDNTMMSHNGLDIYQLVEVCQDYFKEHLMRDSLGHETAQVQYQIGLNVEHETSSLKVLEKQAIVKAMHQANGSKSAAAMLLGISRTTLYRKLNEYGLNE